jgi:uncharacterized protein (TIGR02453 family)
MAPANPVFMRETFRFFKELGRNNRKVWMDANRERYQSAVVQPFRRFLEELAPAALQLNSEFDASGRTGPNFSRINRDIRFAKDKTPYKTQMYLKFSVPAPGKRETGQLYVGVSADTVTAGFRIYSGGKRKESTIALVAEPRVAADPGWAAKQKKRLGRRYESYWYTMEKGEWTKHSGWPIAAGDWKKNLAWIVRRKLSPAAATRASFPGDVTKVFRDLYPLLRFTSLPE